MNYPKAKGRPQVWQTKISAPPLALEFYALIAKLQKSEAFATCHIYDGARVDGVPIVKWQGTATKLPYVVASYMGLSSDLQQCGTPGCCNPFHYLPPQHDSALLVQGKEAVSDRVSSDVAEWADLVEYELDKRAKRIATTSFEDLRGWIDPLDLNDSQLTSAINHLKEK